MGTSSDTITDLFLSSLSDYRLDTIFNASGSVALIEYTEPWLINSIVEFSPVADQSLAYTPSSGSVIGEFTETLTTENQIILSRLMQKYWLTKSINDVLQFENHISDRDFKMFSAAQNLTAKKAAYAQLLEELDLMLSKYEMRRVDWDNWYLQKFDV